MVRILNHNSLFIYHAVIYKYVYISFSKPSNVLKMCIYFSHKENHKRKRQTLFITGTRFICAFISWWLERVKPSRQCLDIKVFILTRCKIAIHMQNKF